MPVLHVCITLNDTPDTPLIEDTVASLTQILDIPASMVEARVLEDKPNETNLRRYIRRYAAISGKSAEEALQSLAHRWEVNAGTLERWARYGYPDINRKGANRESIERVMRACEDN